MSMITGYSFTAASTTTDTPIFSGSDQRRSYIVLEVTGTWTGAIQLVGWLTAAGKALNLPISGTNLATAAAAATIVANGLYGLDISAVDFVAAQTTAAAWTGTAVVTVSVVTCAG